MYNDLLPDLDPAARTLYDATSATSATLPYGRLPEEARAGYRTLVAHLMAEENRRLAIYLRARAGESGLGSEGSDLLRMVADVLQVRAAHLNAQAGP